MGRGGLELKPCLKPTRAVGGQAEEVPAQRSRPVPLFLLCSPRRPPAGGPQAVVVPLKAAEGAASDTFCGDPCRFGPQLAGQGPRVWEGPAMALGEWCG